MERVRKQDVKANRAQQTAQRKTGGGAQAGELAQQINNSPAMVAQRKQLGRMFGDAIQRQEAEDEPLQEKSDADSTAQLKDEAATKPNNTGLPDNLKNGIESLSGMSMDGVKVHFNSSQPAQLNALAYAQGTDIHVAPGQEQHLPHEAWHVVQQAQGRVQPTMQMQDGVPVNDDELLEHEADVMGDKAMQMKSETPDDGLGVGEAGRQKTDDISLEMIQRRAFAAAKPFVSQSKEGQDADGFQSMAGAFEDVQFKTMSTEAYGHWQKTAQAKRMHGVASHNGMYVVTQFLNDPDVVQRAGLGTKAKAALIGLEGALSIAAGIALIVVTSGVAVVPGVLAIITGIIKIARALIMGLWNTETNEEKAKKDLVIDGIRGLESLFAIGTAIATMNVVKWIFGVAKALRSLLTLVRKHVLSEDFRKSHPRLTSCIEKFEAGCHAVEAITLSGDAGGAVGAGKVLGGSLTGVTAASKGVRAGDQIAGQIDKSSKQSGEIIPEALSGEITPQERAELLGELTPEERAELLGELTPEEMEYLFALTPQEIESL